MPSDASEGDPDKIETTTQTHTLKASPLATAKSALAEKASSKSKRVEKIY